MKTPLIFLLVSLVLGIVGLYIPAWSDVLLLAVPAALASLLLLAFALGRTSRTPTKEDEIWVIVDGSNVMHWRDGKPSIEPVKDVLALLKKRGFTAGVMFDANAGYLLSDRYQHDHVFSKQLGLPEDRIMVVPKGTPADPYILAAAQDFGARIVTNDRFRDWQDKYPQVRDRGFLITGWYRDGKLFTSLG